MVGEIINIYKYSNDVGAGAMTNLTYISLELTANILMMNKNRLTLNSNNLYLTVFCPAGISYYRAATLRRLYWVEMI